MKWFIRIVLIIVLVLLGTGFVFQIIEHNKSELIIGIGVLVLIFVLMPAFLFHRYRNRKLQDYMLDKDKLNQIINNLKNN